jgi:hypothetical protein
MCHPPDHLPPEAIRREGEADDSSCACRARGSRQDADPLFQQAGIELDDGG